MAKQIVLHVGGRRFNVELEDNFANYLQEDMSKDFNIDGNNELKLLLNAYVRKSHDIFLMEKEMHKLLRKLNKSTIT